MADLITLEMYTARLGRTLTGAAQAQVEAFIADASALVRKVAGGELDTVDSTTVPAELVPVVFSMVRRGVDNPRGLTSEQLGDYRWAGPGQAIYATDEEAAMVRSSAGLNVIGEATLTGDIPDRLRLDTDLMVGRSGFEFGDF